MSFRDVHPGRYEGEPFEFDNGRSVVGRGEAWLPRCEMFSAQTKVSISVALMFEDETIRSAGSPLPQRHITERRDTLIDGC